MAYEYQNLSLETYQQIVPQGSSLRGWVVWQGLIVAAQDAKIDPLLLLAWMKAENDFATNISSGLLGVINYAGIKYVGQARAYQSDQYPPSNEQGVYAGFRTVADFFYTLARNITTLLPDAWAAGDLKQIAHYYTTGLIDGGSAGTNKVGIYENYVRQYREGGAVAEGVYGEDLIRMFETQIGKPRSGTYDAHNGDHPWAYYCEAGVESTGRNCGLDVVARGSAELKRQAAEAQGLLMVDAHPAHGDMVFFTPSFYYPDGHVGLWNEDRGQLLGTLTDGTGVGYRNWGPATVGFGGHMSVPGVLGARRASSSGPVPVVTAPDTSGYIVWPGNPRNEGRGHDDLLGVGGGIRDMLMQVPDAVRMQLVGYPTTREYDGWLLGTDGKYRPVVVQDFEKTQMLYDADYFAHEWRVRAVSQDEMTLLRATGVPPESIAPTPQPPRREGG